MNYRNKYVPQLSRRFNRDDSDCDLIDIFEMKEVDKFVTNSPQYLTETKIINFSMINAEKEMQNKKLSFATIYRELKKIKIEAKTINIGDFDNYNQEDRQIAYEGTLSWDKNNFERKLKTQTRESMMAAVALEQ